MNFMLTVQIARRKSTDEWGIDPVVSNGLVCSDLWFNHQIMIGEVWKMQGTYNHRVSLASKHFNGVDSVWDSVFAIGLDDR